MYLLFTFFIDFHRCTLVSSKHISDILQFYCVITVYMIHQISYLQSHSWNFFLVIKILYSYNYCRNIMINVITFIKRIFSSETNFSLLRALIYIYIYFFFNSSNKYFLNLNSTEMEANNIMNKFTLSNLRYFISLSCVCLILFIY